jgi:TnpA family transposase
MQSKSFSQQSLVFYGTLNKEDLRQLVNYRGLANKLGFAYQVIFIRLFNVVPKITPFEIIEELVIYAAIQLSVESSQINVYAENRFKISRHQQDVITHLKLTPFDEAACKQLEDYVFKESLRLEAISLLKTEAIHFLKEKRILSPADYNLNRLIVRQRKKARHHIFDTVQAKLSTESIAKLADLISGASGQSKLEKLKAPPARASVESLLNLVERLETIKAMGILYIDISSISSNYQKILAKEIRLYSVNRIQALDIARRNTALVCFLHQTYKDVTDYLIETYIKLLNALYKRAKTKEENNRRLQEEEIRQRLLIYEQMKNMIQDTNIPDIELRNAIYKAFGYVFEQEEPRLDVMGNKQENIFKLIVQRFSYIRQFSPAFIKAIELQLEPGISSDIIEAIDCLQNLNTLHKRNLPEGVPFNFVPKALRKFVVVDKEISKPAWECSLLLKIRDEIKNSNIAAKSSKRFGKLQDFFMPADEWSKVREQFFCKAKLPVDTVLVVEYWQTRLNEAYDQYFLHEQDNGYVKVINDKWVLSKDQGEKLTKMQGDSLEELKGWIASHMRSIKLPDLLVEVDNGLKFTEAFMPLNKQGLRLVEDVCNIIVTIMAQGCNIGSYTMSRLVQDISYDKIKNIADWQLSDEALRASLSWVVNAISQLDISKTWGEGKTSSADVHLVGFREKVLQQTYNPKFGDYALEFYTFVADNYAPYHSTPVESAGNEGAHALDGIYYNESDLPLEEHYTDTKAATIINFTGFAFAGIDYNPRIRGLHRHKIFKIDGEKDYGSLTPLLKHKIANIKMAVVVGQWDRMAQFHASIAYGYTTACVALKKLSSLNSKNEFFQANLHLGRILKTENTLKNMVDPVMRKRRQRGLLKGEEMHQLARDIGYGNQGQITGRDLVAQRTCCSCLTFIMACVVYWQAKEIGRIIHEETVPETIDLSLLEHISPIGWDNVVLYGEYVIDKDLIKR